MARLSRQVGGVPRALAVSFPGRREWWVLVSREPGPWRRVKAAVIWVAQGKRLVRRSRSRRPPRGDAPGHGEDPQAQAFGFPAAGGAGQGERLHPG